jgi:hypothetical protein
MTGGKVGGAPVWHFSQSFVKMRRRTDEQAQ